MEQTIPYHTSAITKHDLHAQQQQPTCRANRFGAVIGVVTQRRGRCTSNIRGNTRAKIGIRRRSRSRNRRSRNGNRNKINSRDGSQDK